MPVVQGETIHDILQALKANNEGYTRVFSMTRLMQIFSQVEASIPSSGQLVVVNYAKPTYRCGGSA